LLSFSKEVTLPITLGLLIGYSGSEQYRLPAEQTLPRAFLERVMKKGDEAIGHELRSLTWTSLADFTDDSTSSNAPINKRDWGSGRW